MAKQKWTTVADHGDHIHCVGILAKLSKDSPYYNGKIKVMKVPAHMDIPAVIGIA